MLQLLRVQSAEGTKRIEVKPDETIAQLFEKVHDAFDLRSFGFGLFKERNHKGEIVSSKSNTIKDAGLKHGDLLYMAPVNGAILWETSSSNIPNDIYESMIVSPSTSKGMPRQIITHTVKSSDKNEDEVDQLLWKQDGKIQRKKDDRFCRHGANACCVHCSPLEPFDEAYLKEQNIKHMSFHTYLRKMTAGVDRGKFLQLEDINCSIRNGCKDHPPWPKGICSKCQPNAITLNRQPYRHVDNVMFENTNLVERFLNYWRITGHQRIGYLYGRYEIHSDVPLGIRAVVAAIYEPPQESTRDNIVLLADERESLVDDLARSLNLQKVGWIFTDLIADDIKKGTVKHVRNIDSHFLSAQECIMAGHIQNQLPNPCRFSPNGYFGSKAVTVCVTGDNKNQVHMEGYQVTSQCMALVRDGILIPTKDAPELGYVRESSNKQYVPDVYYKEKDSYGNEVSRLARPLPVEYLLVDVPASTPLTPQYTFYANEKITPFPVEHRLVDGQIQEFNVLATYLQQFTPEKFLEAVSDFHFLIYIAGMDMLPLKSHMGPLLDAIRTQNRRKANEWARSAHWATVEELISATTMSSQPTTRNATFGNIPAGSAADEAGINVESGTNDSSSNEISLWTCTYCTFLNPAEINNCEMCSLPRM
ncbi:nuclear protein localization protein 4 homolog isoform X1 [Trichogramma pretiosum]|uniref:nuclear protein localization protein 4 homolog isoform X1 n=2 Tax=Trichogramma pretiosum TaxID=7493 RepID=UPI0006C99533|nr:nuclear protein localization protein 4 homolog isoform X1 [Trichogramma pretiosum]